MILANQNLLIITILNNEKQCCTKYYDIALYKLKRITFSQKYKYKILLLKQMLLKIVIMSPKENSI